MKLQSTHQGMERLVHPFAPARLPTNTFDRAYTFVRGGDPMSEEFLQQPDSLVIWHVDIATPG